MAKRSQTKTSSRVNITYDVDVDGAIEKVSLPFVIGVMADLSGKRSAEHAPPAVAEREFEEFTHDNFNDKMAKIKPRVEFHVANELGGGGNVSVDASFESMEDFAPDRVAQRVPVLAQLLKDRKQLDTLLDQLDGKPGAEQMLNDLLSDPARLQALASLPPTKSGKQDR